jgi:hypothetical protein
VKREIPGRGCQLDLHGVQLNVTTIIADQKHEQHVGIELSAIETDAELIAVIKDDADPRILPNPPSSIRLAVLRFRGARLGRSGFSNIDKTLEPGSAQIKPSTFR